MNCKRKTIEELLEMPYWVIDILPKQVPEHGPGQYFKVEDYFLSSQLDAIKQKLINVVLKLNCYADLSLEDEAEVNPDPERIVAAIRSRYVNIRAGDALITSDKDDTCMAVFNADAQLLDLVQKLAASEGLFVWKND